MSGTTQPVDAGERRESPKERRPGRLVTVFKAVVLLALVTVTAYGMLDKGLYSDELWLPVAAGVLALMAATLLVRGYYKDVPPVGWVLVALLTALAGIKGLSLLWTVSETETIHELLRTSMYLAVFLMALASLSSWRQVAPVMDAAVLLVTAVAGYGLLQKISPLQYPVASLDDFSVDSTLTYSNTLAIVLGIGVTLALARLTQSRNVALRGLLAALMLAFTTTLYLTTSRGGVVSLAVALILMVSLSSHRLQMATNLLLIAIPQAWLLWRMQGLGALWQADASDALKLATGLNLRDGLMISFLAAFALQCAYALLVRRYDLTPPARRVVGGALVAVVAVTVFGGTALLITQHGGIGKPYDAIVGGDGQRSTPLGLGFREEYWKVAWNEWKEHPLTGTGAGTFQYTWYRERPVDAGVKQVHNLYLEQGTETGLFAFLAVIGFSGLLVGYLARETWRASGDRRLLLSGLAAAVVVYLLSSMAEWHWYIPASTLFFFILAAVAVMLASWKEWKLSGEPG